jgi:quinol-cytochrome oxidoreductase complex cytochrome b subunit
MQYIIFVHSFEKRVVFLAQKKITQTEPPPPENRKLGLAVQEIWRKHFQGKTTPIARRYNKQNHQKNTKTEKNQKTQKNQRSSNYEPPNLSLESLVFLFFLFFLVFRFSVMEFNFV